MGLVELAQLLLVEAADVFGVGGGVRRGSGGRRALCPESEGLQAGGESWRWLARWAEGGIRRRGGVTSAREVERVAGRCGRRSV